MVFPLVTRVNMYLDCLKVSSRMLTWLQDASVTCVSWYLGTLYFSKNVFLEPVL